LKRRYLLILALVAVLIGAGIFAYQYFTAARQLTTATVRRGDIRASVEASGKVRARDTARLSLPIGGVIARVVAHVGDEVKTGDVILQLKDDEYQRRVQQAQLNLASRQLDRARAKSAPSAADLDIARANLKKAELGLVIAEEEYKKDGSKENDARREAARADVDIARASFDKVTNGPTAEEIAALENQVKFAELSLMSEKTLLAQTQLTVPFDGTVLEINAQAGELVGGYTPLATVADLAHLEILAEVDEIDVGYVAVGQNVELRFDAFPGETVPGKITRLYPAATSQRGSTIYNAIVEFDAGALHIRAGMGASLKITTVEKKNVLLVPSRAVKQAGARKSVTVLVGNEPREVIVETGVSNGQEMEIVSGVEEEDVVVVP
jgi:RND family efflux transporter MFP subunit